MRCANAQQSHSTERHNQQLEQALLPERETVRELLDENAGLKAHAARLVFDWCGRHTRQSVVRIYDRAHSLA
ncbi:MAG TPA: hypothetical protein VHJ19_11605 [Gammaproteobacteria bacterium]|nr:hypothetical protein [Gammaproteobacteria bacterium]